MHQKKEQEEMLTETDITILLRVISSMISNYYKLWKKAKKVISRVFTEM
jgi:hypothetical protein